MTGATRPLRFLLAGDWGAGIHEEPMASALESLGHSVVRFPWAPYFDAMGGARPVGVARRLQYRFLLGPLFRRMNRDLTDLSARNRPDVVLIRRGTHVTRATLRAIRKLLPEVIIVGLCNDDPFAPRREWGVWRHFLEAVPDYDLLLAYRHRNLADFARIGAPRVELLRSWFVPERDHPFALSNEERARYGCDAVFAGHYEPDKRIEFMDALVESGVRVKVFGPEYPRGLRAPCLMDSLPVRPLPPGEYGKALCAAKVALCFFSTINRDTYTRRCFEIPATKTMLLCEYSDDIATLFEEGVEAEFFRSKEELVQKAKTYLADPERRRRMAEAGYRRVIRDGHDVVSRMTQVVDSVGEILREGRGARRGGDRRATAPTRVM